jgi:hypothetical protein
MRKNLLLSIVISLLAVCPVAAQDVQLATLQQGENLQVFYGADALKNAIDAANNGDLITLSAGAFNAPPINKAVTIQGAGYVTDVENNRYPTAIIGRIEIQLPRNVEGLTIEGIYNDNTLEIYDTVTAFTLKKSRLKTVRFDGVQSGVARGHSINCLIDQCRIAEYFHPDEESNNLYVKNSIIFDLWAENTSSATLAVVNCIITHQVHEAITAFYKNNIFYGVTNGNSISSLCSAYNNVFLSGSYANVLVQSGNQHSDSDTLFGQDVGTTYSDSLTYELTESAKITFLGTDGFQVGIYGGTSPFTNVPTNPQVTQKTIDAKSSVDGKLNVSIKVEAQN